MHTALLWQAGIMLIASGVVYLGVLAIGCYYGCTSRSYAVENSLASKTLAAPFMSFTVNGNSDKNL